MHPPVAPVSDPSRSPRCCATPRHWTELAATWRFQARYLGMAGHAVATRTPRNR